MTDYLGSFPRQTIQHHSNPSLCPNHWCQRSWTWLVVWRPTTPSRSNTKKYVLFHHRGLECKSQETPRTTVKFGLGVKNEAGQRLTEFCQENTLVIANILFFNTRDDYTHGHHQMINILKSDWLYSLQVKIEKLYTVRKKQDLIVAQILNSLLPNSDLNRRK